MSTWIFKKTVLSTAIAAALCAGMAQAAPQTHESSHTFNIFDVIGDHDGTTFATSAGATKGTGNGGDPTILCGIKWAPNVPDCDADNAPIEGDQAYQLFPIDSTFGFEVVPFAKATEKHRAFDENGDPIPVGDRVWGEGYVGIIFDEGGEVIGIEVADAETDTFVVPAGLGTWCTGLGGASVKCSTEHFVTMEQVLTCHETVPYYYADPLTGAQAEIVDPENPAVIAVDCADAKLDNNLIVMNSEFEAGTPDTGPIDGLPVGADKYDPDSGTLIPVIDWAGAASFADPDDVLSVVDPNEATVLDDIMKGASYSVTAKDDGKPLYRWGNLIKRPNDVRLYARMALPTAWYTGQSENGGNGYRITKARLIINHDITNNPNDQVRPEDMENEGAIGRLPGYDEVDTYGTDSRISDTSCYQGNGLEIPAGTVLKNNNFKTEDTVLPHTWDNDPYAWSEDLREGFTAAWYTTLDREPFEWSYDTDGDMVDDVSYRAPLAEPLPMGTTLLSGPRWRLLPPKFGQDLPGIEVPKVNCAPPPYQKDMIKYERGALATETDTSPNASGPTILDLLSWEAEDERSVEDPDNPGTFVSPLTFSNGWVTNGWYNDGTEVNKDVTVVNPWIKGVTVNGLPVTRDFDLSIYVKGDRKPTALYNARLEIEWDDGTPE